MHTFIILAAAAATCALARPPGPTGPSPLSIPHGGIHRVTVPLARDYGGEYLLPRLLIPHFSGYDDSPRMPAPAHQRPDHEWLNKEIERLSQMEEEEKNEAVNPYDVDLVRFIAQDPYLHRLLDPSQRQSQNFVPYYSANQEPLANIAADSYRDSGPLPQDQVPNWDVERLPTDTRSNNQVETNPFALTPLDDGYFDLDTRSKSYPESSSMERVDAKVEPKLVARLEPPRQIRQNPNLSRTKTLVAENINILRNGVASKELKIPVSLLPTNLRWLKINDDDKERSHEEDKPTLVAPHVRPQGVDASKATIEMITVAASAAASTVLVVGLAIYFYTVTKRAKEAADVDYPAYGVTGPTTDNSGDRKLAHSAHMYHYQHQKQQIIAMERNGLEQRNGSVSDPESEEENEEGDYTVYECPGFATTGDMEVKNPLFSDDPTPATPGQLEVVKQQPKQ